MSACLKITVSRPNVPTEKAPVVKTEKSSNEPVNPWAIGRGEDKFAMGQESESELVFKEAKQIKPAIYAEAFANRLSKNLKRLEKWAKREKRGMLPLI